jgi:predicted glutamine amidotransferase
MLGLVSKSPGLNNDRLDAFYPLCKTGKVKSIHEPGHLNGWGIAGTPNGQANYYGRSARPASEDREAWQKAVSEIESHPSQIILAHFRKASVGNQVVQNTHPFIKNGWLFCHNGTLFDHGWLPLKKYAPEGDTDSERLFLFLLEALDSSQDPKEAIENALRYVQENLDYNSLTFLLANSATLYAHRNYSDQRMEKGETLEEREGYYTLWSAEAAGTLILSSEPLPTAKISNWNPLPNNELFIKRL